MLSGIREVRVEKDADGNYQDVRLVFGPHYFVNLHRDMSGAVSFTLGATHHGFKADASEVNGALERIIEKVRKDFPESESD